MRFELTAEFLYHLMETSSPEESKELLLLSKQASGVSSRLNEAKKIVKEKLGTIENNCLPITFAYIDPTLIEGFPAGSGKTGVEELRAVAKNQAKQKLIDVQPSTPADIYKASRVKEFVGGIVIINGSEIDPNASADDMHAALIVPGLLATMDHEPASIGEVLSCVGFISDYNKPNRLPTFVSPTTIFNKALFDLKTKKPMIGLFFSAKE